MSHLKSHKERYIFFKVNWIFDWNVPLYFLLPKPLWFFSIHIFVVSCYCVVESLQPLCFLIYLLLFFLGPLLKFLELVGTAKLDPVFWHFFLILIWNPFFSYILTEILSRLAERIYLVSVCRTNKLQSNLNDNMQHFIIYLHRLQIYQHSTRKGFI